MGNEIDLGPLLKGLRGMREQYPMGGLSKIYSAIEPLRELPFPPAYLDGVRDELIQMLTGRGKVTYYAAQVYLAFYGDGERASYLKIGIAKDVGSRLSGHATSNPIPRLWTWTAGFDLRGHATTVEAALLKHMQTDKIHGEWVSVGGVSKAAAAAIVESLAEVASVVRGEPVEFEAWGQ